MITVSHNASIDFLLEIRDKVVLPEDDDFQTFADQFVGILNTSPTSLLVLEARDGRDLRAFVIAQDIDDRTVLIVQLWSDKSNDWEVAESLLEGVYVWARELGRSRVMFHTTRNYEAFIRRRPEFRFHCTTLVADIGGSNG